MATSSQLDPVQGLIDYVLEIKPYHTKIVEVLIEHVHTDCLDVTITEDLNFCVNIGIPNLNSKFMFEIVEVDVGSKLFKVTGDARFSLIPGQRIQVVKSEDNDGYYTVQEITYDYGIDVTSIYVTTSPVSSSIVGTGHGGLSYIVDNSIIFCPENLDYPFVKVLQPQYCPGEGFGASYYDGVIFEIIGNTSSVISVDGDKVSEFDGISDIQVIDSIGTVIGSFAVLSVTLAGSQTDVGVAPSVPTLVGTNYLYVRNIPYDTSDYTCGAPSNGNIVSAHASFTESLVFQSYDVIDWFQTPIIAVDGGTDTFTVVGNIVGPPLAPILEVGEDFEITGSPGGANDGVWTVSAITFNGTNTEITVTTSVGTTEAGGYVRSSTSTENLGNITIALYDAIGTTVGETATGEVVTSAGSFVGSWDYPLWDIGSYDEAFDVTVNLYTG